MFLSKQLASTSYRHLPRIAYVAWPGNIENYKGFYEKFGHKSIVQYFDLSDPYTAFRLRKSYTLKQYDLVIDDFSKHPMIKKEIVRDFYDSNISRSVLFSEQLEDKDIEAKIQYKTFVNWNKPSEIKKILSLPEKTLNELAIQNEYFRIDLMNGMIACDKRLSQEIFSRLTHKTILELLITDIEKIMKMHSASFAEKEIFITKSCWQHVPARDLLKAFNAFAWQNPEVKDPDMAAMILNVFQSIILKDESVIRLNDQIEMIQVGVQLGKGIFDELLMRYLWLYFYFKELVILYKDSEMEEVGQVQEMLKTYELEAHMYRDIIPMVNQLSQNFDVWLLWAFVFERGYADEVIEYLLIHLVKRDLITERTKDQLLDYKKNGYRVIWAS